MLRAPERDRITEITVIAIDPGHRAALGATCQFIVPNVEPLAGISNVMLAKD